MALLVTREIRLSSSVSAASIGTDVSLAPGGHGQQGTCFSPAPPHRGSLPYASTHLTASKVAGLCPARAAPSGSSHPPYLAVHQGFLCVAFDFPASTSHRVFLGGGYAASSFGSLIQNLTLPTVFNPSMYLTCVSVEEVENGLRTFLYIRTTGFTTKTGHRQKN